MQINYALHKIDNGDSFTFNPTHYSKFKFGDDEIAESFGVSLAQGFINRHLSVTPVEKKIVVISSPYAFIPTATFSMKNYFVYELNKWLVENNFPVVEETKIHRTNTYIHDYGELNAEERMNLIGNDSFHIDNKFLENKTLIFLDDIRITGSHEKMIHKMIESYSLFNDTYLLYYAELVNQAVHPNIENFLNYHHVKSIFDLDDIVKNKRFSINTRIVKYILKTDTNSFKVFIQNQNQDFINLLYNMALGNNYYNIEDYKENITELKQYITDEKNTIVLNKH